MDNLLTILSKVNRNINEYIVQELRKNGIKGVVNSHGAILMVLSDEDKLNYSELSERVGKTRQTMTTLIRKLEKEGYIDITLSEKDKRNKIVSLSEKGKEFIPLMMKISKEIFEIQYQGFSDGEKVLLKELLMRLDQNFINILSGS